MANNCHMDLRPSPAEAALLKSRGYYVGSIIARGSSGNIHWGTCKGKSIAVKAIKMNSLNCEQVALQVLLLKLISHPNVVQYLDLAYLNSSATLLVYMEYMSGGDLHLLLHEAYTPLTEPSAGKLFRQIGEALCYMHTLGYAHRDLKSRNILLDGPQKVAKISDFGNAFICTSSKSVHQILNSSWCGTVEYLPPEVLQMMIYDFDEYERCRQAASTSDPAYPKVSPFQADIWSMAVLLFEMLNEGRLPFKVRFKGFTMEMMARKLYAMQCNQKMVPFKESLSPMAKGLIKKMLVFEPKDRPQMADILKDEWFTWVEMQEPTEIKEVPKILEIPECTPTSYLKSTCSIS